MRTQLVYSIALVWAVACIHAPPAGGPLGEGTSRPPEITAIDSLHPPRNVTLRLERDAYAVVMLVAPGHSASILYPKDSTIENKLSAGAHEIAFEIPVRLARNDTTNGQLTQQQRQQFDSASRARARYGSRAAPSLPPVAPNTPTYILVVSSPQPLVYARVLDKTAGWSIPLDDIEALNAVAKQVKSTIVQEPRDWAGAYHVVTLAEPKKK